MPLAIPCHMCGKPCTSLVEVERAGHTLADHLVTTCNWCSGFMFCPRCGQLWKPNVRRPFQLCPECRGPDIDLKLEEVSSFTTGERVLATLISFLIFLLASLWLVTEKPWTW